MKLIESKKHKEQSYRVCLGLLNLSKKYDRLRLDQACDRSLKLGSIKLKSVKSILEKGMEQQELPFEEQSEGKEDPVCDEHINIRGPHYYH